MTTPHLPGLDPKFHEARCYMTPHTHNGMEILAFVGACKENGCGFRVARTTRDGRDRAMWIHRALTVRKARLEYFQKLFPGENHRWLRLQCETADNNSHYFSPWKHHVENFFREIADDNTLELPDYDYLADYRRGSTALDTVNFLFEAGLR